MLKRKKITTKEYSFTAIYEPVKEGGYQVMVPLLGGLITYGRNFEEAKKMVRDAIVCYLESLKKEKEIIPNEKSFVQEKITVSLPCS
ncbi:type II toxin-antitoxin system HicB family antitoxin [Patescibacteria group bacterium]